MHKELEQSVYAQLRKAKWLKTGGHVLAAVSGGADSMAMMHLLARSRARIDFSMTVASVDHGLRPESSAEVAFVKEAAEALDLPFHGLSLQLSREGNLQSQAREARYEALRALADRLGCDKVAVGHTLDDQAETVLDRMLRGSGVRGLRGILAERADGTVRPLLHVSRRQLRSYLAERQLAHVEDPSNQADRFKRVRLRALLDSLEEEDPQVKKHLCDLAQDAAEAEAALEAEACRVGAGLEALRRAPLAVRKRALRAQFEAIVGTSPRRSALEMLVQMVERGAGELLSGQGWRVTVEGAALHYEKGDWKSRSTQS